MMMRRKKTSDEFVSPDLGFVLSGFNWSNRHCTEPCAGDHDDFDEDEHEDDEEDDEDDEHDGDDDDDEDEADISFVWIELIRQTLRGVLLRYRLHNWTV